MTKKIIILISFSVIFLFLVLYLILTSGSVKESGRLPPKEKGTKITMTEGEYKAGVKAIFYSYENLVLGNNLTIEKITDIENELLEMKGFQAKFQTLHLNFVLALDRMKNYLVSKKEQEKNASQQMVNQLKADYAWLNN